MPTQIVELDFTHDAIFDRLHAAVRDGATSIGAAVNVVRFDIETLAREYGFPPVIKAQAVGALYAVAFEVLILAALIVTGAIRC